jgi:hypothetical protein
MKTLITLSIISLVIILIPVITLASDTSFTEDEKRFDQGDDSFARGETLFDRGDISFNRGQREFDQGDDSFDLGAQQATKSTLKPFFEGEKGVMGVNSKASSMEQLINKVSKGIKLNSNKVIPNLKKKIIKGNLNLN